MNASGDPRSSSPARTTIRRATHTGIRTLLAWTLLFALVGTIPVATPAGAGPDDNFSLSKTDNVGGEALIGEEVTYTLTATGDHVSGAPLYNLSFRDVLPVGVDFVSASPSPTAVLEDTPGAGETTVIWSNVSDLPANSLSSVRITVDTNADVVASTNPVGSTITNNAESVASLDPFAIPDYSTSTGAFTGDFDGTASASRTVDIIPFRVEKTAPAELLRGVHGGSTVGAIYTVEVENNPDDATNSVTVVDVIHPGLEFLGCDTYYAADNTSVGEEWTGSGPVATGAGCSPTPISVETADGVTTYAGSVPPAGSTVVTWDLANLAPGQVATIQYQAGIPLFENRPFSSPLSAASVSRPSPGPISSPRSVSRWLRARPSPSPSRPRRPRRFSRQTRRRARATPDQPTPTRTTSPSPVKTPPVRTAAATPTGPARTRPSSTPTTTTSSSLAPT